MKEAHDVRSASLKTFQTTLTPLVSGIRMCDVRDGMTHKREKLKESHPDNHYL